MNIIWHNQTPDKILVTLKTKRSGLASSEAVVRLQKYGLNILEGKRKVSSVIVFLQQFRSPLIYVLLVAAIISFLTQHLIDAWVIVGVLFINAFIGFLQETRAEKAMEALLQMAAPRAKVRRDGTLKQLPARELVPGDILLLETGDKVPADARLIEVSNLKVNEASLTGESMPVEKYTEVLSENVSVTDRKNMVYMSTIITYGRATAVVIETGMTTEIGKIASSLGEIKQEKTPLQKSINKLSQYILGAVIGILAILIILGLVRGLDWLEIFLIAVATAVSAIPEGLPVVVTIVLAIGMQIMARRNAIIRNLAAVETVGSATVICSDKTGTLTHNEMTVHQLYVDRKLIEVTGSGYDPRGVFTNSGQQVIPANIKNLNLHLRISALCNDALLTCDKEFCSIYGDPTEGALVVVAAKAGMIKEQMERIYPRIDEIPFQSEKQYMATLHHTEKEGRVVYIKGSVERILQLSSNIVSDNGVEPLSDDLVKSIMQVNEQMAQQAMRVIATAYTELPAGVNDINEVTIKGNLILVGLAGMADPPRKEAIDAVSQCKRAGIKVVMITGDHKITAESIGHELHLPTGKTVTGTELEQMSEEELTHSIAGISIFARIEPLQKLRIVNAFKKQGYVVAMTGDGVNDAPALKAANIGIAMGITGTDVAKEACDMVLADDNFASVVSAVEEGRAIFNRLRNVVFFLLSTNLGELLALVLCVSVFGKTPLLALQIIWINLVTDTTVDIPLGLEPKFGDELQQPPRHPKVGLIFPGLFMRVAFMAIMMSIGIFLVFNWAYTKFGLVEAQTIAFCTMAIFEWFRSFNARSDEHPIYKVGLLRNRWLIVTLSIAILLQIAVVYVPFLQIAFGTVPIGLDKWGIAILAGGSLFIIEELRKIFFPNLFSLGKWRPLKDQST